MTLNTVYFSLFDWKRLPQQCAVGYLSTLRLKVALEHPITNRRRLKWLLKHTSYLSYLNWDSPGYNPMLERTRRAFKSVKCIWNICDSINFPNEIWTNIFNVYNIYLGYDWYRHSYDRSILSICLLRPFGLCLWILKLRTAYFTIFDRPKLRPVVRIRGIL